MIPLTPDPDDMPRHMPPEHCCFCGSATRMWYAPRDVAVCTSCAEIRDEAEVPTKDEWCESPQAFGYVPHPGTVVIHRLRSGQRTALHRNDDGTHTVYVDDFPSEDGPMDQEATIAWLTDFVNEVAPPPPSARERYGRSCFPWAGSVGALKRATPARG